MLIQLMFQLNHQKILRFLTASEEPFERVGIAEFSLVGEDFTLYSGVMLS